MDKPVLYRPALLNELYCSSLAAALSLGLEDAWSVTW